MKSVFNSLHDLNNQGFPSWVSRSYDLAESYQIDMESCIELSPYQFKELCHERLKNSFIMSWMTDLRNGCESSSILKTYSLYKMNFGTECYLKHISKPKFRIALSKLRASSHDLEVERGRYVRPKLDDSVLHVMSLRKKSILSPILWTTGKWESRFSKKYLYENQGLLTGITEENLCFYCLAKILKY